MGEEGQELSAHSAHVADYCHGEVAIDIEALPNIIGIEC